MSTPEALKVQVGGSHYKGMKIQHVEFVHANGIPYIEANAIKYICRHRSKNGRQDIEKAIHYLQILLDLEYPPKPEGGPGEEDPMFVPKNPREPFVPAPKH
jgi:hypothetical protein